ARRIRCRSRPPVEAPEDPVTHREQRRPAVAGWRVKQQRLALVSVTLSRWPGQLIEQGGAAIHHRAEPLPGRGADRMARRLAFHRREQRKLGDEALILGGKLAADAGREGVADQFAFKQPAGFCPPGGACREPGKGTTGHQLPGSFCDDVIVGRGPTAPERCKVLLMATDLPDGQRIVLEEFGYRRPALKQPPDPGHADQPDANLDAAGPVHAGQERVLLPPGLDLLRYPLRVRV